MSVSEIGTRRKCSFRHSDANPQVRCGIVLDFGVCHVRLCRFESPVKNVLRYRMAVFRIVQRSEPDTLPGTKQSFRRGRVHVLDIEGNEKTAVRVYRQ